MIAEPSDIKVFEQLQTTGKYVFASQLAKPRPSIEAEVYFRPCELFLSLTGA